MTPVLLQDARVLTAGGVLAPGWVRVAGGHLTGLGPAPAPNPAPGDDLVALPGHWVLPGLVDLHVHGGNGASLGSAHADEVRTAAAFHRRHGTTRLLASLVTAPLPELARSVRLLAHATEEGTVAGIHLEGPFLARSRCGAQDPRHLLAPDRRALGRLLDLGRGAVRMVTIAPELPGALDVVREVVDRGVVAAVGHTDATYEEARAAFDAGARVATHLFNAMAPPHHRRPGPVHAALEDPRVVCELIVDGVHLHPAIVRHVLATAGPARVALVTDAMAAAGLPDGRYRLGHLDVAVTNGVARLAGGETIAGSTTTTGASLRRAVRDVGLALEDVVRAAATTPARVLEPGRRPGVLEPGGDADLVVCDEDLAVAGVMVDGAWVVGPPGHPCPGPGRPPDGEHAGGASQTGSPRGDGRGLSGGPTWR